MPTLPFGCILKATPTKGRLSEWGNLVSGAGQPGASLPSKLTSSVQVSLPTCKMGKATLPTS